MHFCMIKLFETEGVRESMKKILLLVIVGGLIAIAGCKKCFHCTQYCTYCIKINDTTVAYKICATRTTSEFRVDSIRTALQAANFSCNQLEDERDVCDNENAVDDAAAYYQKQDYHCAPKEE